MSNVSVFYRLFDKFSILYVLTCFVLNFLNGSIVHMLIHIRFHICLMYDSIQLKLDSYNRARPSFQSVVKFVQILCGCNTALTQKSIIFFGGNLD